MLGVVCPLLGVLVVLKRMAFFADAVAHLTLPGVVLAMAGQWEVRSFLLGFTMTAAAGMLWVKDRVTQTADTVLGIFSAAAMALGIVLLGITQQTQGKLLSFLVGDILAVGWIDLVLLTGLTLLVALFMVTTLRAQVILPVQTDLAQVAGFSVTGLNYGFVLLLAAVVTVTIKVVGALLVTAFLVIPAALARQKARSFMEMLWLAPLVGISGAVSGVLGAVLVNAPAGPLMVLVMAGMWAFAVSRG